MLLATMLLVITVNPPPTIPPPDPFAEFPTIVLLSIARPLPDPLKIAPQQLTGCP
jgi:hypothetical protein